MKEEIYECTFCKEVKYKDTPCRLTVTELAGNFDLPKFCPFDGKKRFCKWKKVNANTIEKE